ncbi:MAG: hypothetical protein LBL90_00345 [Prevotellaceae bacterium]|jgi:hypothetical protein|nr:hypothetical protein [Prevotellaceae bacterium]
MGLFDLFKFVRNNKHAEKRPLAVEKENNMDKLFRFEKEEKYEEYINTLKEFGLMIQIEIVCHLENATCLQKIAMGKVDSYVAHVAIMRIQDVNVLMEIIALHKWDSSSIGQVGILRLIDFDITEKIRIFLDSIKDNGAYERGIKLIAKVLLENQQFVREMKSEAYSPRCATEPIKWFVNLEQFITLKAPRGA